MKLYRLSLISIVACVLGLVVLLALSVRSAQQMEAKQAEIGDLLSLDERIDTFSTASDSLLIAGADRDLWQTYRTEGRNLQAELEALGRSHPDALKAAHRVRVMVAAVESALDQAELAKEATGEAIEPLDVPPRSRIIMQQVANQGIALDTALDDALGERQRAIASEARWIAAALAGSALVFGALCVIAFGLIHRRMALPARTLVATLERIRNGDTEARAAVGGNDELAQLAQTLNLLLDERQAAESKLRERQERIEATVAELETTRDHLVRAQAVGRIGSWDVDLAEGRLEWSDQVFEIFGIAPEAFSHTEEAFFERVHPDDLERVLRERADWLEAGGDFDIEHRIVQPNGEVRWVHERARAINDTDGKASYTTGTVQDITERRRQEARVRELQELIEGGQDLCAIADDSYRYRWANQAYLERYRLSRDELEGSHLRDVLGADYFEREIKPRVDRCLAGEPQRFETERAYSDSGPRILLVRYYPIDVPGVARRRVGAVITDVTSIRETEAEMASQARLLDIAGRAARFGGWSVDLRDNVCTWSNVTAEIHGMPHGYSPSVDEGISFYAPEYRGRISELFSACVERGCGYDEELQIIDGEGRRRWVRTTGEPVYDESGTIVKVHGAFQDITESKTLHLERQQLSERLATMLESITEAFVAFDEEWRTIYVNPEAERIFGRSADELLGTTLDDQVPQLVGSATETAMKQAMETRRPSTTEQFFEPLNAWFDVRAYPWTDGIAVFFRDVSETHRLIARLKRQDSELRESRDELGAAHETLQLLINSLPAHIAVLDAEGNVIDVNERWRHYGEQGDNPDPSFGVGLNYIEVCEAATGECADDAKRAAQGVRGVLSGEMDRFELEYPCHAPDRQQWFRVVFNRLAAGDGASGGAVAMHVEITERKLAEQELERIAYEDPLTGALTRIGFGRSLQTLLDHRGWKQAGMVVTMDIVGLRDVNEAYGYELGDQLLVALTERLREIAGAEGLVGRIAGDEFALYLLSESNRPADDVLEALTSDLKRPFRLGTDTIEIDIEGGCTILGPSRRPVEQLVREAELAMFENLADDSSQTPWVVFAAELGDRTRRRIQLTKELRHALEAEQFELHFQPKVDLDDGRLIAAEALLRWNHPERGLQPPGSFIPIAEQSQLIGPIGHWALRAACRHLHDWQAEGLDLVRVSVNVSLIQFLLGDFPAEVRRALRDFDVAPGSLSLEITESVFERHSDKLLAEMRELHEVGVRLSLDDFGTGYSSLRYLQQYPFDEVKIDRAFTAGVLTDRYSRDIVGSVMNIAKAMDAETVAEGIESHAVAQALLEMGCRIGQGFYYSMPLEAEDFGWLLGTRNRLPLSQGPRED